MTTYEMVTRWWRGTAFRTGPRSDQPSGIARGLLQALVLLLLLAAVLAVRIYVTAPF